MNNLFLPIIIPFAAGALNLLIPRKYALLHKIILVSGAFLTFAAALNIFINRPPVPGNLWYFDGLSALVVAGIGFFGLLVSIYSLKFYGPQFNNRFFSGFALWTMGASAGAAVANNYIVMLVFWGFVAFTFYVLINLTGEASGAAKKTLIIIGGTDAFLILGVGIIWAARGSWEIVGSQPLALTKINLAAFLCLALAALAKAGALPVHTWVPDVAQKASVPVTALLPASIDKLLGIYLLTRITADIFAKSHFITYFLIITGALTVIVAVMMAIVQHDFKKLLGYHAVSQVGYMVLGIGTGTYAGYAGALFHMINNAIYKSTLFLSGGAVEKRTGTSNLDALGGLSRIMPLTFASTIIASLAISGVPPLNGFVSKWLIYQGLIELYYSLKSPVLITAIVIALLGSALTLASFMKLIHAVFLSSPKTDTSNVSEVPPSMWWPMIILSGLCVIFGIFAFQLPLKYLILPCLKQFSGGFSGFWQPGLGVLLVVSGTVLGAFIYFVFMKSFKIRFENSVFTGGEILDEKTYPSGTGFYLTIHDIKPLKQLYSMANRKFFDIYDVASKIVLLAGSGLAKLHTGILQDYLSWVLLGFAVLLLLLI